MEQLTSQTFFDRFDCAFNSIDEQKLRSLLGVEFVRKGENLLVLGGAGSGKTDIAAQIETEVTRLGFSSHHLHLDSSIPASASACLLDFPEPLLDRVPNFRQELLEVDVLVVEEAHRWLLVLPRDFMLLLCERIASGKTNILLIPSHGWKEASRTNFSPKSVHDGIALHARFGMGNGKWTPYGHELTLAAWMRFSSQVSMLGIGHMDLQHPSKTELLELFYIPSTPEAKALTSDFDLALFAWCDQSLTEWMYGPGWKPVWHVLYTGENSYR